MSRFCPECGRHFTEPLRACPDDGAQTWVLDPADKRVGRRLDNRFTIIERLGGGGMGTVYRARQHSMDRDVALKLLLPERVKDDDAVRRFLREARAASRLANPHTVSVFDFGRTDDGEVYLAMELMKGRTLTDLRLASGGTLETLRAVRICDQALGALEEAHAAGILHRDLKPENIFILDSPPDFVKVLDFGLAKLLEGDDPALTEVGKTFGTPEFMSPEQAYGKTLDPRSDLYSLGLVLFELLAGRLPFQDQSSLALIVKRVQTTAPRIRDVAPHADVSEAIEEVVARMLSIETTGRPASAKETRRLLREATGAAGDPTTGTRARHSVNTEMRPSTAHAELLARAGDMLSQGLFLAGDGWRFYGEALSRCTSQPGRELFRGLLSEQAKLATLLRQTAGDLAAGTVHWDTPAAPLSRDLETKFDELSTAHAQAVRADGALLDQLDMGITFERKGLDFWERHAEWAKGTPVLGMIQARMNEFRNRVGSLAEVKLRAVGIARGAGSDSLYSRLAGRLPVRRIPGGTVMFRQGDSGDAMVVVVKGRFHLRVQSARGVSSTLAEIGPGDVLGEMSCLDPAPRSATVTALTDAEVYDIDRGTLAVLRENDPGIYVSVIRAVIRQVTERIRETDSRIETIFRDARLLPMTMPWERAARADARMDPRRPTRAGAFSPADLVALEGAGRSRTVRDGEWICREGDDGQVCYVITAGQIEIVKALDGGEIVLAHLVEGSIVGQIVLVDGGPRSASVRAWGDVQLVELDRPTFERLVEAHVPVAMRFQEQLAITGIRQLRLADRWLATLMDPAMRQAGPSPMHPARVSAGHRVEIPGGQPRITSNPSVLPAPSPRRPTQPATPTVQEAKPPAPEAPQAQAASVTPTATPSGSPTGARQIEVYMRTALREWGMSLDDLDEVKVVHGREPAPLREAPRRKLRVD